MKYILLAIVCTGCATQEKALLKTECVDIDSNIGRMTACPMPGNVICYERNDHFACVQILGPRI